MSSLLDTSGKELECLIELENQYSEHSKHSVSVHSKKTIQTMKIIEHISVELSSSDIKN